VPSKRLLTSILLLIVLGFIWGSGYSLARYAMTHGVPPLGYSFWQASGPAVLLIIACIVGGQWQALTKKSYWKYYLICGLSGIAIPNTNMYFVANKLPAGILAILVNTVPVIVYPLALGLRIEPKDIGRLFAVILGCAGIAFIINPSTNHILTKWALVTLVSPLCFALCALYISVKQPTKLSPLPAACGMLVCASLLLIPLVWQQHAFYPITWPMDRAQEVVLLEIILSTIGYLVFFRLIRLAGPVFYSLTGTVVALTGLFWGYILFNEQIDMHEQIGIVLIITALSLLSWRQSQIQKESEL